MFQGDFVVGSVTYTCRTCFCFKREHGKFNWGIFFPQKLYILYNYWTSKWAQLYHQRSHFRCDWRCQFEQRGKPGVMSSTFSTFEPHSSSRLTLLRSFLTDSGHSVKYVSMWLLDNHIVRYHLLCQLHIQLNQKVCHSINTVHMLNTARSSLVLDLVCQISGSSQSHRGKEGALSYQLCCQTSLALPGLKLLNLCWCALFVHCFKQGKQNKPTKQKQTAGIFWGREKKRKEDSLWSSNSSLTTDSGEKAKHFYSFAGCNTN